MSIKPEDIFEEVKKEVAEILPKIENAIDEILKTKNIKILEDGHILIYKIDLKRKNICIKTALKTIIFSQIKKIYPEWDVNYLSCSNSQFYLEFTPKNEIKIEDIDVKQKNIKKSDDINKINRFDIMDIEKNETK